MFPYVHSEDLQKKAKLPCFHVTFHYLQHAMMASQQLLTTNTFLPKISDKVWGLWFTTFSSKWESIAA